MEIRKSASECTGITEEGYIAACHNANKRVIKAMQHLALAVICLG